MIEGLDSAQPPTPSQARAARAAGVRVWSGYLATRPSVGLYHPWAQADFEAARLTGSMPIAYCSGNDDPGLCRALAQAWDVRLCLDVEAGIRADGPWVGGWLAASGAGLYGNASVHSNRVAPFHILAAYPTGGDPGGETWPSWATRPPGPCGWQWAGSHSAFGVTADSNWLDDSFGTPEQGGLQMDVDVRNTFKKLAVNQAIDALGIDLTDAQLDAAWTQVADDFHNLRAVIDGVKAAHPSTGGKLPAFEATITPK